MVTHSSSDADMPDDSVKPVLPHSAWSEECIRTDDFLGQCISWGTPTEGAQSSMTTDGSGYSWTAAAESQTAVAPNNPDLLPTPGTHVATTEVTKTTQAQIPTSNPSVSQATTAPTLASVGTINEASSNNSNNLSSGAVAGIAIGTLIIGFALAFLAAFFLFKRRSAHRGANVSGAGTGYTSYADSTPELVKGGLGGRHSPYVQVSQTPIPPPPLPKTVEEQVIASLPPAAQDGDVHARITALFEQIHRHIETYYRDVHASITPSMEPELARFGAGDVDMAEMLQNCSSATTALKHALVTYVLGITSSKRGDGGQNLFPEELSGTRHVSDPNLTAASSLHRRLAVYLYTSSSSSLRFSSAIREAAEHFSLTFFPWANPTSSDQDKDEDLARVIAEALETRIWLFGQPDTYEFEWEGTGRRGVLVSPGLVRTSETGQNGERVVEGVVVGV